jgi:tRNA A-37 threonylcarbamoyl transferase component Bud32
VAGKYEIEALIGQGGMGAVYRAQHTLTHRRVALKWLLADDAAMRMRFVREARAMGALEHPNVVGILDIGEEDGAVYLVMEYVEGESLREHLDRRPVSPMRAVRLLMPALEGIAAAHQAGIVHRDLKPANLFVCLDRDGTAYGTKVLDFGVALSLRQSDGTMGLTQSGAVVGTPRYMAPEQIRAGKVDARTDQFAMGLILYEMLTGRLPYDAAVYEALVVEIATVPPLSPRVFVPDLPEGLPGGGAEGAGQVARRPLPGHRRAGGGARAVWRWGGVLAAAPGARTALDAGRGPHGAGDSERGAHAESPGACGAGGSGASDQALRCGGGAHPHQRRGARAGGRRAGLGHHTGRARLRARAGHTAGRAAGTPGRPGEVGRANARVPH